MIDILIWFFSWKMGFGSRSIEQGSYDENYPNQQEYDHSEQPFYYPPPMKPEGEDDAKPKTKSKPSSKKNKEKVPLQSEQLMEQQSQQTQSSQTQPPSQQTQEQYPQDGDQNQVPNNEFVHL